ncbi:hypothetical protein K438DRAFT_1785859 [Mycena galopus ATCC 62051]|nr:hypothetical protein K438DRAFT_1785859 [Mycena galopus ATCC 62051]
MTRALLRMLQLRKRHGLKTSSFPGFRDPPCSTKLCREEWVIWKLAEPNSFQSFDIHKWIARCDGSILTVQIESVYSMKFTDLVLCALVPFHPKTMEVSQKKKKNEIQNCFGPDTNGVFHNSYSHGYSPGNVDADPGRRDEGQESCSGFGFSVCFSVCLNVKLKSVVPWKQATKNPWDDDDSNRHLGPRFEQGAFGSRGTLAKR